MTRATSDDPMRAQPTGPISSVWLKAATRYQYIDPTGGTADAAPKNAAVTVWRHESSTPLTRSWGSALGTPRKIRYVDAFGAGSQSRTFFTPVLHRRLRTSPGG